MMKWSLVATILVYITLIFIPMYRITVNGKPMDNSFYRIFGDAVMALIFFVTIGMPIYTIRLLF